MAISLFLQKTTSVQFTRDGGDGYWDDSGRWVEGTPEIINTVGNLQPYRDSNKQSILPEGKRASDAYTYFTSTPLNTSDQFTKELADTCVIDGRTFYAHTSENWSRSGLLAAHYKVILIREDQDSNGSL